MNVHNCMSDYHHCSTGDYRVIFDIRDTRVAIYMYCFHINFTHLFALQRLTNDVMSLEHIILIPSQPVFCSYYLMLHT
jgi:hypothetical protein